MLDEQEGHARIGGGGMPEKNASKATRPPADAPRPTMGKLAETGAVETGDSFTSAEAATELSGDSMRALSSCAGYFAVNDDL
jgi:hypothetical protein